MPKKKHKRVLVPEAPVGKRYGMWTVVGGPQPDDPHKMTRWRVRCDCGNESYVRAVLLRNGGSSKCAKCRDSGEFVKRHQNANWKGYGKVGGTEYNNMKRRAIKKGYAVEVTIEDLSALFEAQGEKCALTGIPLTIHSGKGNGSIDRIDSKKGYVKGNVQWVDKRVNMMKNAIPEAEFVELCRLIYLKQEKSDV